MKIKIWVILCVLLCSPLAGLCLDVQVQVDKNTITREDFITWQVIVEGASADIDVSAITDFKVDPVGTSTSVSIINGKFEKKTIYQYRLFPVRTGDLVIPSIPVTSDDDTVQTQEIRIKVADQAPQHSVQQDLFATATLSGEQLYVGQQALYSFKLFTTLQFARATLSEPSFAGFQAKPAGERKNYSSRINGRVFNVSEVNYVLIPQKEGPFEIEPSVVTAEVIVRDKQNPLGSFFSDSFFSSSGTRPVRVSSEAIQGKVVAIPLYSGPGVYSGLVGVFDITAAIDTTRIKTGESATLTVRISGTGNIMDSAAPRMDLDHSVFKMYDDTPAEEIVITPEGYSGFREFKKALVPASPGTFVIPSVSLTYFHAGEQQYKTVSTNPIPLTVDAPETDRSENKSDRPVSAAPSLQKQDVVFEQKDILTIKENLESLHSHQQMPFLLFGIGLVLPGVLFFCFRGILALRRKDLTCSEMMEKRVMLNLKKARSSGYDSPEFLTGLYTALISKILAKDNTTGETLTIREVSDILVRAGHSPENIREVIEMIETIESAKFSGKAIDSRAGTVLLEKTTQLIRILSVFLCAGLIFITGISFDAHADDTAMTFLEGVKLYHAQEYRTAAERFETLADTGIKNGHLYYNLGNAFLKAGDIGRAILWYERALKLIPNDPDLKFNMDFANTLITDKIEAPAVNITDVLFFWLNFLPMNGIQMAAIFCSCLFFLFAGIQAMRKKTIFKTTGTLLGFIFLVISFCALYDYYRQSSVIRAVVINSPVAVRSGLSSDSTRLFELHAGTRVDVKEETQTHLKILFSNGKIGWVSKEDVQAI